MSDMRVWVGCLGCYNEGRLIGEWVGIADADPVAMGLAKLGPEGGYRGPFCKRCGADEFWCFDHEYTEPFLTGEFSPYDAQRLAEQLDQVEEHELETLRVYIEGVGTSYLVRTVDGIDWQAAAEEARDKFVGRAETVEAWAEEFAEETGLFQGWEQRRYDGRAVPLTEDDGMSVILRNVDWKGVAEEWTQGYTVVDHDGEVWLFSG